MIHLSRLQVAVAVAVLTLTVKIALSLLHAHERRKLMPPSPHSLPLLGHIFQLPPSQWLQFTELKAELGPIFSLNLAGQPIVVVNTMEIAADLLRCVYRRSQIYSSHPQFIMAGDILTGGIFLPFVPYGDMWRKLRRAAHEGLNVRASQSYQPLLEKESALLVSHLLQVPEAWDDHLNRSAASTILSAVYGFPPLDSGIAPIVNQINEFMHRVTYAILPGAFFIEVFPAMMHLLAWLAKWKREGFEWHRRDGIMFEGFMENVQKKVDVGESESSFAATVIEHGKKHNLTTKEAAWLSGAMFGAGSDTTAAAGAVFMLAMALYPDVMRCAQAELDAVVGCDHMPTFADHDNLPYVCAIVKEVLWWRPVTPLGIPRRSVQDDWYNGYFIPKGTLIFANIWAMNRDPELFPDFDEFRPERYLDASGALDEGIPNTHSQGHSAYGFGRWICVGMHFANQELFINFASILWALDIEKALYVDRSHIIPSRTDFVDQSTIVRPVPFKYIIKARSRDVSLLVEMAKSK